MQKFKRATSGIALVLTLGGCGGGGGDKDATSTVNVTTTDAAVVANVKSSNIDFLPSNRPTGTWRWSATPVSRITVYVPTPASGNATEQDYATKTTNSIAQINSKLSGLLILESTASLPLSGSYMRVSYGTSYLPPGSTNYQGFCANVSTGANLGNVMVPDNQNGIAPNPVFINLGNGRCDVTQDIVTHEFGHALGLATHFSGFGDGPAISTAFWDVLASLYGNPVSTVATGLLVKRAAN